MSKQHFSTFEIKINEDIYTFVYKDQLLDTVLYKDKPMKKPGIRGLYNYCLIISSDKSNHRLLAPVMKKRVEKALKKFYILNTKLGTE